MKDLCNPEGSEFCIKEHRAKGIEYSIAWIVTSGLDTQTGKKEDNGKIGDQKV